MPHNLCIFCVTLLYFSIPISHKPTIIKYTKKNDIKASAISTPSFVTLKFDVKTLFLVSERILTKKKKKKSKRVSLLVFVVCSNLNLKFERLPTELYVVATHFHFPPVSFCLSL